MDTEKLKTARKQVADLEDQLFQELAATASILGITLKKAPGKGTNPPAPREERKVKYSDGTNEWSGKGKRPQWLKDQLAQGRQLEEFEVRS